MRTKKGIAMSTDMLIFVVMSVLVIFMMIILYLNIKDASAPASSNGFFLFIEWLLSLLPGVY